jgi:septal ring-binding cell division protein DamX
VTPVVHAAPVAAAAAVPIPAAKASGPVPTSLSARLGALEQGDLDLAVRQGRRLVREIPPAHCTLRLEIACQGDTIRRVVELFKGRQPDLFLLPMPMRDGRGCYQVLFGRFPTPQAAERALKRLPASFLADRNRPKVFRFSELQK